MTDKAYIVANKEQELDVLNKFERGGLHWPKGEKPTEWIPTEMYFIKYRINLRFPYALIHRTETRTITSSYLKYLDDTEIIFDGRKEENMYNVTQEFMNELIDWRNENDLDALQGNWKNTFSSVDFKYLPDVVSRWRLEDENPIERNNRLIAIIQWLNGEDMFEVEESHKFVVRSDNHDEDGDYAYVSIENGLTLASYFFDSATKFDTREEAQGWANSHQVVVEIDENGNEVE